MNLPNRLTLLRIALTPVFMFLLFMKTGAAHIASLAVFCLAAFTDWYDGYAARKYNAVSQWGKFLDPLADKILVLSAFLCFWMLGLVPLWMLIVMTVRDALITAMRCYSILRDAPMITRQYARVKTFGQYAVLILLFFTRIGGQAGNGGILEKSMAALQKYSLLSALLFIVTCYSALTGILYCIENRSRLRRMGRDIVRLFVPSDLS